MKKIVTLDGIMVSFIAAIGYGLGYVIPVSMGLNELVSLVICLVVGWIADDITERIIFSRFVQKNNLRRFTVFALILAIFAVGYSLTIKYLAHSLWEDFGVDLIYTVGIPVVGFCISLVANYIKKQKMIQKHGSGEKGFIIDEEDVDAMKSLDGENAEITDQNADGPIVKTFGGNYVGRKKRKQLSFLGIPYAKAPVGDLRWKRPIPVDASDKTFEAFYFGDAEIQPEGNHNLINFSKQSEDCLNLNIWTSVFDEKTKRPVVVYFHGGDGRYGGSVHPVYHLQNISKAIPDAVFVSVNYRLGIFGSVDFSGIDGFDTSEYEGSSMLALYDCIEALKWVKNNISAFGGDPENITAVGDCTGGCCLEFLPAMKEGKGLFKRAIVMATSTEDSSYGTEKAMLIGQKIVEGFNVKSVADLANITAEDLRSFELENYSMLELIPKDGKYVPNDMMSFYESGAVSDIEFIFGITADEVGGWKAMVEGDFDLESYAMEYINEYEDITDAKTANQVRAMAEKYSAENPDPEDAWRQFVNDYQYKASILRDCKALTKGGSKVRCFYWDVKGDIEKFDANSISLVSTMLGNKAAAESMGYLNDKSITEVLQAFVEKFINGKDLELYKNEKRGIGEIKWSEFSSDDLAVLHIKSGSIEMDRNAFSDDIWQMETLI